VSVVANVAINLDARGVVERLKAIRQSSSGAADGFKRLQDRAQAVKAIVEAQQGTFAKASTVQGVFSARVLNTEKAIRAQIAALREVQSSVKLGGALYQKAASQIQAYEKTLRDVNAQEKINNNTRGGAIASLGRLAASFAVLQAGRFIFAKAAELQSQARSLEVLTGSTEKAGKIIKELQQLGAVTPFTSTELIDSAKRLQAFGVEADKVVETTRRLADASGATGAELSGLVTAYGQVQAKGRLQGEELLQFQERGIALQEELRKMYGMTSEEFQKALSKGQISAKAVEVALVNLTSAGGKYANGAIAQSDTLNGRLSTLQDGIDGVARSVGAVLSPVVLEILKEANRVLSIMPGLVDDIGLAFQYAAGRLAPFLNGLSQIQWYFKNLTPPGWAMQVTGGAGGAFRGIVQEGANRQRAAASGGYVSRFAGARDAAFKQAQMIGETPRVPPLLGATGGGGGRAGGGADKAAREAERAAEAAAREAARVKDVIRDRLAEGQIISLKVGLQDRIAAAEAASDKMLAARLQSQERELEIQYRYAQELAKEANLDAQKAIMYEAQNALTANQIALQRELDELQRQSDQDRLTSVQKYIEKQYELNTVVQNQLQLTNGIADTLGQGIGSAFNALVSGAQGWEKSLQQIASGVLIDIANQLIRIFVIEQAINSIKSFLTPFSTSTPLGAGGGMVGKFGTLGPNFGIPQRAKGGPVMGGSPYIVGERGPELFVPGSSGTIIPNNKMGGGVSIVVNVDASGSSVEGNEQEGQQLGRVIAAAMQAELIKQKRPGGLLA
jgi:tape measure domain-containing protein